MSVTALVVATPTAGSALDVGPIRHQHIGNGAPGLIRAVGAEGNVLAKDRSGGGGLFVRYRSNLKG